MNASKAQLTQVALRLFIQKERS